MCMYVLGNVAVDKDAFQANYVTDGYHSSLAVDGDTNPDLASGHCSSTYLSSGPAWWYLDLGAVHYIERVKLFNALVSSAGTLASKSVIFGILL